MLGKWAALPFATALALGVGQAILVNSAQAIDLRSGYGGPEGFGDLTQFPNDDGSSNQLNMPFTLNFFGNIENTFFVNNNGNITFNGPVSQYTPSPFPISNQPMIAPYWGDVDTRSQPGGGAVYAASPDANTTVVTWHNVGYYSGHNNLLNDFQLTLLNRSDTGAGNFDIEFRYRQLQWTTGDASGGSGGFGGTPAQAGYDAGNQVNFFALPGSRTAAVLQLAETSNVSTDTPGLWTFAIRNGTTSDGSTPDAPLLPEIVQDDGWHFDFNIQLNQRIFIDPLVATGYDYAVTAGPNFASVILPTVAGDTDGYDIVDEFGNFLAHVNAGFEYFFGLGGVARFGVRDIDVAAALDPNDTQAFVTGLTFVGAGSVQMIQTPVTTEVNGVPEPSTLVLVLGGLASCGLVRRRKRQS